MGIAAEVIATESKQFDEIFMSNQLCADHFVFNLYTHDLSQSNRLLV